MEHLRTFFRDERGETAIEYCLIAGVIACFLIGSMQKIGSNMNGKLRAINNAFS